MKPLRVVFFGDSICKGQDVSLHLGWVTRLSRRLHDLAAARGREAVVDNPSINGNTTRQALERMAFDVQGRGVDLLLVQFGMNDCNHWPTDRGLPRVSLAGFVANLEEIIARGVVFGARRVVLLTTHPTTRDAEVMPHTDLTYEQSHARYADAVRGLAARDPRVTLCDVRRAVEERGDGPGRYVLSDGLHLSPAGHDLYVEAVGPVAERALLEVIEAIDRGG